jgi:ABC-2 type transport system permease protein
MTTAATPSQPPAGPVPLFAGVLRSEARKLTTVRSTFWALLAAAAFNVVTAALLGALLPGHLSAHQKATIDSVRVSLGGLHLSQIAAGLLGVLAVTSEYSSGMIRATLADPGVLRAVTGAGLYLTVLGLLGFGLGTVLRSSAGAVAVLLGVLFVPTLLAALLPSSWQDTLGPYLPMNAGDTIYTVRPEAHMPGPWAGFGVFCLYAAGALTAGFVLIGRRDA